MALCWTATLKLILSLGFFLWIDPMMATAISDFHNNILEARSKVPVVTNKQNRIN